MSSEPYADAKGQTAEWWAGQVERYKNEVTLLSRHRDRLIQECRRLQEELDSRKG